MFDDLGEGVFRRRYSSLDLNIGVVIGDDGVLLVDTRATYGQAEELISELTHLTRLPVRWVVNSHFHWDHVFGNARFPNTEMWGHELCRRTLIERGEDMKSSARAWLPDLADEFDEVVVTAPDKTFSDRVSLNIGRRVVLSYHGLAHTDSDIVVSVPDAGVAFLGDIVEEGAPPNFGDSYPFAWPETLATILKEIPPTVVPGHGDVVDREFVTTQLEELSVVADLASRVLTGEISVGEAAPAGPYPNETMTSALQRAIEVG